MSRPSLRRALALGLSTLAMGAAVSVPSAAHAAESFFSKRSGTMAQASWLEVGADDDAMPGNHHFGDLFVEDVGRGKVSAFGTVYDVQCQAGVEPYLPFPGHHGAAPEDGPCTLVGTRFLDGGALTFTINKKTLASATLTGTLAVGDGHGGPPTAQPKVSIGFVATGKKFSSVERGRFTDEFGTSTYRYSFTGRNTTITAGSAIGAMVFDDEPGEFSTSHIGRFSRADRFRG